jgi:NosR/NirI family nitrous oxide reductase transcriptional regulator
VRDSPLAQGLISKALNNPLDKEEMKKGIIVLILMWILCGPLIVYGQWEFFEHRYRYKLEDVLDASKFIKKGGYWEGYKDGKLVGYVFLSKDWTAKLVGYSGKHMETLIGIDTKGVITGVKLVFHSEPIVLIGLKDENYQRFMKQYPGKNIRRDLSVGKEISMDAITGATVTAVVQNAIILGSARKVASLTGLLQFAKKSIGKISKKFTPLTWKELLSSGAVKNIVVTSKELGIGEKEIYLDLYFGVITPPSIGRNILGNKLFRDIIGRLKNGESALFVVSRGKGSFKGSGFARGGVFDRFNLEQEDRVYVFRDKDYRILTHIKAQGAPPVKEGGIFIIRGKDFDSTSPFKFNLILPYRVGARKEFKSFSREYKIPDRFLE